ncbi:MAG: polyhydroxyalkanoic acid system family protein [Pseudomonadota bacterium]
MPRPVTITVSHDLGKDEAKSRINEGFGKLKSHLSGGLRFKFTEEWTSADRFSFTARGLGQSISGHIDVFPAHIRIEAILPGFLAAIAETITGKVEKESQILLEKK